MTFMRVRSLKKGHFYIEEMTDLYLLYEPLKIGRDGQEHGGPIYIKTGSLQAYVGFSSEVLAKEFSDRWNMIESVAIIPANELGIKYRTTTSDVGMVVLFSTKQVLETYFHDPVAFPCEKYFVSLASVQNSNS